MQSNPTIHLSIYLSIYLVVVVVVVGPWLLGLEYLDECMDQLRTVAGGMD